MRQFAAKGLRIWNLGREAKVIYSFFCILSIAAIASSVLLYEDLVGPTLRGGHLGRVGDYYSTTPGEASRAPANSPSAPAASHAASGSSGPAIALHSDEPAAAEPAVSGPQRLTITVPYRKLLEVTHFHLFTVPVFLLILTHLFLLTGLSPRAQLGWITLGWLSATLHIAAPWLVRAIGRGGAWLHAASGTAFLLTSLVLCLLPLFQMWKPQGSSRRGRPSRATRDGARPPKGGQHPLLAVELDSESASRVDTE